MIVLITLLLTLLLTPARAAEPVSIARQGEAVGQVVLGILSYVRWPQEPAELQLCVVGPTEFADGLLSGLVQNSGRHVAVQRRAIDDPQLGESCDAVYLGALGDFDRRQVGMALSGHAVLSISERDPDCSVGSMFCLDIRPARVAFAVNLDAVARSGVRVHPNVLKLARQGSRP